MKGSLYRTTAEEEVIYILHEKKGRGFKREQVMSKGLSKIVGAVLETL